MKKIILFVFIFISLSLSENEVYSQEMQDDRFVQKCDSLIDVINEFDPMSGNSEYDLYIINNVLPKTIDYINLMKQSFIKAKEMGVDIDYEFMIDEFINELEGLRKTLK